MVDWDFLKLVLLAFGFLDQLNRLIMICVRTPKYSISLNGELHGFFPSGHSLCQGDPISPYLFTLVIEVFLGILSLRARQPGFLYFWRCKALEFSHLFFVDDVFLFYEADMASVSLLKGGLDTLLTWSGLRPNTNNSEVFFVRGSAPLWS